MKLTTFILMLSLVQASASTLGQSLTLVKKNVTLDRVFYEIRTQTGYDVLVSTKKVDITQKIDANFKDAPLKDVLEKIMENQPLEYTIKDKKILIKEKEPSFLGRLVDRFNTIDIRGRVLDESGRPLGNVTVKIKGSTVNVKTSADGHFIISVPDESATLIFSFVGYATREMPAKQDMVVALVAQLNKLEETVIVGYGNTKKKDLTGSVSIVSAKDIKDVPFTTVDNALAGKAAGVQVTKSDGTPGGAVRIRIRGSSSLLGGNDPLYVIDGVPVQVKSNFVDPGYTVGSALGGNIGSGNGNAANAGLSSAFVNGLNSLGGLNPDDIESITILKDASSTAIYGSKAANGVVIITTKRGNNNMAPVITTSYYTTISTVYNTPKLLNADQYKMLLTEAANYQLEFTTATGFPLTPNASAILNNPSAFFGTADTRWIDEVTRSTVSHNAEVSVQGGANSSKYFSSLSYNSTPGVVKGSDFERISGKLNLENSINAKFRFITNLILGYTNQNLSPNVYAQALKTRPDLFPYDASGNFLNFDNAGGAGQGTINPLALASATNNGKAVSLLGSISAIYDISKELQFKSTGSLNWMNYNQRTFSPSYLSVGSAYGNVNAAAGIGSNSNRRMTDWLLENTLTYNKEFNENHSLNVLVGQSYETVKSSFFSATAQGYPNDNRLTSLSSAVVPFYVSGDDPLKPQSYLLSFYLRANYSLMNKYLFTFTGRTDGSSKFGPDNKFGYFPSGAVAWRISQENFLKDIKWIDDIKFRGSFGLTGTQNIGDQMYRTLYSPVSYNGSSALVPSQLGNQGIKWESTKQADGGVDVSLFENRLNLTVDHYSKKTSGTLLSLPVAPSSSYKSLLANAVGIKNKGWEFSLAGDLIRAKNFKWIGALNVTFSKSLVTSLNSLADLTQIKSQSGLESLTNFYGGNTALIAGEPLGIITGQKVIGIIKNQDELDAYKEKLGLFAFTFPPTIGDPMFQLDASTEAEGYQAPAFNQIIGYGAPKYYGGITQGFSYKKFDLQFYFTYSVGGQMLWGDHAASMQFQGTSNANAVMLNRSTSANVTNQPRLLMDYSTLGASNLDVFSSSYLKLRTLTMNYHLNNSNWLKRAGMKNAELFVSATNLFTLTKYPGSDPETSNDSYSVTGGYFDVSSYPTIRTFSIGLKAGF